MEEKFNAEVRIAYGRLLSIFPVIYDSSSDTPIQPIEAHWVNRYFGWLMRPMVSIYGLLHGGTFYVDFIAEVDIPWNLEEDRAQEN